VCRLAEETPDMRATIEHGLRWLEERFHPGPDDDWLLSPADHPSLDALVVRHLAQARAVHPDRSIFVPAFEGRRGHPALIGWKHVAGIRSHPAGQGLNAYLRRHTAETLEVPVASAGVLCDLDTPEDYERLLRAWRG
jgi:CTP:molybdopterin cytidylyltransferase MocA